MKNLLQQEIFLRRYDKNVKEIYRRMLYDAQKEIESFYGRYASKECITINEAKKRVSRMDVEAFSKTAKRMVETKDFSPQANAALRLYNLTMKVNRLELLKARIGLRLVDGFDEIDKLTETLLKNSGLAEFKMQSFERNGYTHYVFIARERACDHCAPLDGKIFAVKDIRPGVNAPPIHPHCFCSIAAATTKPVQAKELAGKHIERMKKVEPKITSDLSKIAAETNAQMAGLEYRLKTEDA